MPLRDDEKQEVMQMINLAVEGLKAEMKKKPEPVKQPVIESKFKKKEAYNVQ